MAEKISKDEVKRIAQLARLELTEPEVEKYQGDLSAILDYVDVLNGVDVKGVEATANITGLTDVYAQDVKNPSFDREEVLKNAPDKKDGYIKVKPVLE